MRRPGGWRSARSQRATGAPAPPVMRPAQPALAVGRRAGLKRETPATAALELNTLQSLRAVRWTVGFVGLLAYVFAITTYRLPIATQGMVLASIGVVFEGARVRIPMWLAAMALFLLWSWSGQPTSLWPEETMRTITTMAKLGVVVLVLDACIRDRSRIRFFAAFYVACYMLFPARGALVNYFIFGYRLFGRALWNYTYGNPNDLAASIFFPLALTLWLFVTEGKGKLRFCYLASAGALALLILLTQSRGALIALVVSGLVFLLTRSRGRRVRTVLMTALVGVVIIPFVPDSAWTRFGGISSLTSTETLKDADPERSAEARYHIWRVARRIIADHPISGVGLGAYSTAHAIMSPTMDVPRASMGYKDTHSTYLNVTAETGYVGLVLFVIMVLATFVAADGARRKATDPMIRELLLLLELGLVGFLVSGIFGSFAKLNTLYLQMGLLNAIALMSESERKAGASSGASYRAA